MFPPFITSYKDHKGYIYLYFYPGLDDNGEYIYETITFNNDDIKYEKIVNKDGSVKFKLANKKIICFHCQLVHHKTQKIEYQKINIT